jgi:RHS repeat-associated protein
MLWTLGDHLNTVRDLAVYTSGQTTVATHRVFDAFGKETYSTAGPDSIMGFTGKPFDEDTGLQNNINRWYEAGTGKWLSEDPIGYRGGINLYEYVGDRPTSKTDPTGLRTKDENWFSDYWYIYGPKIIPSGKPGTVCLLVNVHYVTNWFTTPFGEAHDKIVYSRTICVPKGCEVGAALQLNDLAVSLGDELDALSYQHALERAEATLIAVEAALLAKLSAGDFDCQDCPNQPTSPTCFPADTPVAVQHGEKSIQCERPGDEVWAYDLVAEEWWLRRVVENYEHDFAGNLVSIAVDGETIEATSNHPFWVVEGIGGETRDRMEGIPEIPSGAKTPGRWVDAGNLRTGDVLLLRANRRATITSVAVRYVQQKVYNFQVEGIHTYAVGRVGVLVHNKPDLGPTNPDDTWIDDDDDTWLEPTEPGPPDFWTPDSGEDPPGDQFPFGFPF